MKGARKAAPRKAPTRKEQKASEQRIVDQLVKKLGQQGQPGGGSVITAPPVVSSGQPRHVITNAWSGNTVLSRCRRALQPHLVAAGLLVLGELLYIAAQFFPAATLIGAVSITGVAAVLWAIVHSKVSMDRRLWADACILAGSAWTMWCSSRGLDWTVASVLGLGECALAARWWKWHRIPYPNRPQLDQPVQAGRIPEDWRTYVAHQRGMLPGVPLVDHRRDKHSDQWTVQLPRDGMTVGQFQGRQDQLAHALNLRYEDLVVEQHSKTPSAAVMKVITASPIKKKIVYDRPRVDSGKVLLGPYADGVGEAYWRTYTENSMWGGIMIGSPGSGKSRMIEMIAIGLRSQGDTLIFFLDGQRGASSPALKKFATWTGGPEQSEDMLVAIEAIMAMREEYNDYHELIGFSPSKELPGIFIIIDECHRIFTSKNATRWNDIARTGRKVGIAILAASQYPGLKTFANDATLRLALLAGNGVALRTDSNEAGQLIAGLEQDPSKLPKIPGYGYTIPSEENESVRAAPFRGRWIPSEKERTEQSLTDAVTVFEWMERYPEPELDEASAMEAGEVFTDRVRLAAERKAKIGAKIGNPTLRRSKPTIPPPTQVPGMPPLPPTMPMFGTPAAKVEQQAVGRYGELPPVPVYTPPPTSETPSTLLVPPGLSQPQQNVFMALAKGYTTPKDIAAVLDVTDRYVAILLNELIALAIVRRAARGQYELVMSS